jgi:hypothetical protein
MPVPGGPARAEPRLWRSLSRRVARSRVGLPRQLESQCRSGAARLGSLASRQLLARARPYSEPLRFPMRTAAESRLKPADKDR